MATRCCSPPDNCAGRFRSLGDGQVDFYNLTDALASTANFLRAKGWKPGRGYAPGQPNFRVIEQWNAATVYQQSIALMAARIDGN